MYTGHHRKGTKLKEMVRFMGLYILLTKER